jgi:hypothetical protein
MARANHLEPWLDSKELADHLGCSVRWIKYRLADGLPSTLIAGRHKFKIADAEKWLEKEGHLVRDNQGRL